MDIAADDRGKVDIDMLSKSLDSTLKDTHLVFELVKAGGYAAKIPMFAAFGIAIYALNKYTSKKKFHRKGEEHGSARWANVKEVRSLLDNPKKVKLPFKVKVHNFFEKLKFWKHREKGFIKDNNVVLTNEVKMSLNTRQTRKNLNVMVIGGSGSGKSRFYVKPNLMQANTSYVCTDPKGELLRSTGKMLEHYGYDIRVFNLIDMAHSNNYNPFQYIYDVDGHYSATAVIKMVNVLMKNTSKENSGGDQFWDDSTKALLAALCFYLVECEDKSRQNFSEVMKLLKKAEVKEGDEAYMSDLDLIFDALENPDKYTEETEKLDKRVKELNLIDLAQKNKKPNEYMCIKYYKDFKKAAGDTAKSILISTAVRLQAFNIPEVMDLTSCDNIHLETIGDKPAAMFIIIPSSDDTFNFLAAMMYTQLFDVLYDRANFKYGGRLPVHVRCLLDEFANLGQIPRFEELLATMRSMEISANVIIQNLSQLKKMYKDSWENVLGNCDSLLFLGGQEPTTLEHISKTLGKETIDTRSHNRTRGRQGSTSENDGILGRELMTVDELKTMKDNECILFVRGIFPFFCNKFKIEKHPNYKLLEDFNGDNAYLVKEVMTVKFGQTAETDDEDLHSEPSEDNETDEKTEHESAPENNNEEKELDCHVEDISVDSVQPHSRIAEMEAAKRLANIPKKPKNGKPEPASLDDEDTVVTTEPEIEDDKDYICVNADDYLDNYDEF
ncbi:MAG: type IV secretory system conjugative DNA transfer family protein [Ruminococcus sp.]|nr:type IV secretory system conjugative DNA transfer family protein [Ruminococcus sp.]